ncbi:MAG: phosphopantetheine-binding protein [bacterium]
MKGINEQEKLHCVDADDTHGTEPGTAGMRLEDELKKLIISGLQVKDVQPEELDDSAPIFGEGLGLDSLDAIELAVILKKHYQVEIKNRNIARDIFVSVKKIADYIREHRRG